MVDSIDSAFETASHIFTQHALQQGKDLNPLQTGSARIMVVRGEHDSVESVFRALKFQYALIEPHALNTHPEALDKIDTLFVNCAGSKLDRHGLSVIQGYVERGGKLVTTDWAVEHVIQQLFPNTIRRLGQHRTGDEVVNVQPQGALGVSLVGLPTADFQPRWWLESSSYPIEILNPAIVNPIVTSEEMQARHGSPYITVAFPYGGGAVLHFVSHLKAQRAEVRNARDAQGLDRFLEMTGTVRSSDMDGATNVAGLSMAFSTLTTLTEVTMRPAADFTETPSGGKAYRLGIRAEGYSSVEFTGADSTTGINAVYNLTKQPLTIGRGSHNLVNLGDTQVSRNHSRLEYDGKTCLLADTGSTNGTLLNGKRIESPTPLHPEDVVKVGRGTLRFSEG